MHIKQVSCASWQHTSLFSISVTPRWFLLQWSGAKLTLHSLFSSPKNTDTRLPRDQSLLLHSNLWLETIRQDAHGTRCTACDSSPLDVSGHFWTSLNISGHLWTSLDYKRLDPSTAGNASTPNCLLHEAQTCPRTTTMITSSRWD